MWVVGWLGWRGLVGWVGFVGWGLGAGLSLVGVGRWVGLLWFGVGVAEWITKRNGIE